MSASIKPFESELARGETTQAVPDPPDEWKQLKVVWFSERIGPPIPLVTRVGWLIGREGVVKMGGGDVPRATGHGACPKGVGVTNKVGAG